MVCGCHVVLHRERKEGWKQHIKGCEVHGLYSPWDCKESNTTGWLSYIYTLIYFAGFFSLNTIIWRLFLNSISVCICLCMCASMLVAVCVCSLKFNKYLLMTYCVNMCKALGFYQWTKLINTSAFVCYVLEERDRQYTLSELFSML